MSNAGRCFVRSGGAWPSSLLRTELLLDQAQARRRVTSLPIMIGCPGIM